MIIDSFVGESRVRPNAPVYTPMTLPERAERNL
jgi:hypothetical protein